MGLDYAREKYWQAIDTLVGASTVQERLTYAAEYLSRLRAPDDISDPKLSQRHLAVMQKLTSVPLSNQNNSVPRPLSDTEATDISREILSIYIGLRGGI